MYVRTTAGLAQDQESWSAPHALNRAAIRPVPLGHIGRLSEPLGNGMDSCEARYNVEYFNRNSDAFNKLITKDINDIWLNMYALLQRKIAKVKARPGGVNMKEDVKLHLSVKGYVDVHSDSDPQNYKKNLDTLRASAVVEALHLKAMQKGIPRKNIEYEYSGGGQFLPRIPRKPGKNRRAEVCIRWEILPAPGLRQI
jgi:acyl-CoA-binding protein